MTVTAAMTMTARDRGGIGGSKDGDGGRPAAAGAAAEAATGPVARCHWSLDVSIV
jgi:hypothetical protein